MQLLSRALLIRANRRRKSLHLIILPHFQLYTALCDPVLRYEIKAIGLG